jgi:hypothetical protein
MGTSDVKSTPIVFGAWAIGGWLWGGTDDEEAAEGIHAALDAGINAASWCSLIAGKVIRGRQAWRPPNPTGGIRANERSV